MGCFCEKLPGGGAVRHLELINFTPGQTLVFSGALGPAPIPRRHRHHDYPLRLRRSRNQTTVVYSLLGYQPAGMAAWAAPVNAMLTEQFTRLKNYVEHPVTQGKVYKFEKEAEGVYYATGGLGSNNVVIVNDDDVLLVDDGTTPATARALVEDIKLLTPKPIRTVVNTHFHYDHTDGNSILGPWCRNHRPRIRPHRHSNLRRAPPRTLPDLPNQIVRVRARTVKRSQTHAAHAHLHHAVDPPQGPPRNPTPVPAAATPPAIPSSTSRRTTSSAPATWTRARESPTWATPSRTNGSPR